MTVEKNQSIENTDDGSRLPVLIAGAGSPIGLAVAGGLRDSGIPLVGATHDWTAPACRSKLWQSIITVRSQSEQGWLEALDAAHDRHGRMVLLAAEEYVVRIIAQHAGELESRFHFVSPNLPTVDRLLDKAIFHDWALTNGFPVPRTMIVRNADGLRAALRDIGFPVVFKPSVETPQWRIVSPRDKVYRFSTRADVERLSFDPFEAADHFVVQEWIPGRDSDVYFCLTYRDRHGVEVASQTGRKLAQWRVGTGNTALGVTHHNEELHKLTHRLFDAAGHVGFGSLEVRLSSQDGRMLITEPTAGRPNMQSALATAAGVNLFEAAYRDALGLTPAPSRPGREAIWIHETTVAASFMVAARRRSLDVRAILAALRTRRAPTGAFFSAGDPLPLLLEVLRQAGKVLRLALSRVSIRQRG
jgi:D-aspartate ligase